MKPPAHQTQVFLTLSILFLCVAADLHGPVVRTKLGLLKGKHVSVKGKETQVHAYLGVPFAKPPVGPLRLAPTQPAEGWEGVRDATQQPPMCVQDPKFLDEIERNLSKQVELPDKSEDCLYLNIYTPVKPSENRKLPVMVWIHGGGLTIGSASSYDGSALAAYQDVVVVLIQYRLGILGFFSTGDKNMPGNFGLLDQVEALRWVQEHIHNFGGDPGSVTIFGESAGGVSVSLLLLSPLSAGLFHGAIAESGSAAMDMIMNPNPLPVAQIIANLSGCDSSTTEKIAECVMKLSVDDIVKIHKEVKFTESVTVDGKFLLRSAKELFQNHEMHNVPLMIGCNSDEAGWLFPNMLARPGWVDGMDREEATPIITMFTYHNYGAEGDYLAIGMEQVPGQHLKKDRFNFFTQTLPEKTRQHQEKMEL
ncbi:fatty acyl-CoA hydrolase precursor, medium chain-like [Centroberyx gerrardi]